MKQKKNSDNPTRKISKKNADIKNLSSGLPHYISRKYLTDIFLDAINEQKQTTVALIRSTRVSKGTFLNMKRGKLPGLPILCHLFATPMFSVALSPEGACWAVNRIISESLRCTTQSPVLRLRAMNKEASGQDLPSLPHYMKSLRHNHLNISIREACRRFDYCSNIQIARIEKDCINVGIGPICNLFDNYLRDIPTLPDEEWSIFATLVFRYLFPAIHGYTLQFVGWKSLQNSLTEYKK